MLPSIQDNFVEIIHESRAVRSVTGDCIKGFYTKSFINSTSYQWIGFTVIGGFNSGMVNFLEPQLFG